MVAQELPEVARIFTTKVNSNGNVSIPRHLIDLYGVEMGDKVTMTVVSIIRENHEISLKKWSPETRTFTKTVNYGYRVNLPTPLMRFLGIRKGDYITVILHAVHKGGEK